MLSKMNLRITHMPLWLSGVLCLAVLWFDVVTPRGVAAGIAYIPLVFFCLWFPWPRMAFVFAAITTVLTIVVFFVHTPNDVAPWMGILNRTLIIACLWLVAIFIYFYRKTQELFLQNESRLSTVGAHALDGLISINEQGIIEHFNPACERIFGYAAKEVIGQNIKILMPESYHSELDGYLAQYHKTGVAYIIASAGREASGKRKDGSVFPMDLSITAYKLADGKHFSGILRDVTIRKLFEEKNALLSSIVTSSDDAIISKTLEGIITSWNDGAERLFGYNAKEAIGQHVNLIVPPDKFEEEKEILARLLQEGELIKHFETVRMNKGGWEIPISLTISPIRNAAGHIIASSKILRDITQQRKTEAKMLLYTTALERSNKELDDFAYIASHDLKEPLRGLFNNAKFLEDDYKDKLDAEGIGRLHRLGYLTQRMEQLVNDLLYFSRLGRQEMAIMPTDLNVVIRDIQSMMETTLSEKNATIIIPNALPEITCDKTRVTEIFRNLITNAVKYNDQEEKIIEIGCLNEMQTEKGIEKQVFYVRDNGIGIEEEFYEDIFRIFKRLNEEDDDNKGTGVGLTFVRKIIDRHGGRIWLESSPGKGTTFYFTITQGVAYAAEV